MDETSAPSAGRAERRRDAARSRGAILDAAERLFAERGFDTVQRNAVTWRRRPFVLDHVFFNAPLRCVGHRVESTPASDHHVLVADFDFGRKEGEPVSLGADAAVDGMRPAGDRRAAAPQPHRRRASDRV